MEEDDNYRYNLLHGFTVEREREREREKGLSELGGGLVFYIYEERRLAVGGSREDLKQGKVATLLGGSAWIS